MINTTYIYFIKWDVPIFQLRPGFAEDNCWFSICSRGITVFLYIPVSLALILNFIFFSISAWKISRAKSSLAKTQETLSKQPNGKELLQCSSFMPLINQMCLCTYNGVKINFWNIDKMKDNWILSRQWQAICRGRKGSHEWSQLWRKLSIICQKSK